MFTFADETHHFNGTCFIKFGERYQAIEAITRLNNKYSDEATAKRQHSSLSNIFWNENNPPYNSMVARVVEKGRKFEIKFAEKKKKDKDTYLQSLLSKDSNFYMKFNSLIKQKIDMMPKMPFMTPPGGMMDMMSAFKMF